MKYSTVISACLALALAWLTPSAHALTFNITYDASVTAQPNAAQIEAAFAAAAKQFSDTLTPNVVVNILVGWGEVGGAPLPSGTVGASRYNFLDGYSLVALRDALALAHSVNPNDTVMAAVLANYPTVDPTGLDTFYLTTAQAQAIGYLPPQSISVNGAVGFKAGTTKWDFDASNGIAVGYYDFQGIAAHEIGEVLGRSSSLNAVPTDASELDLLRYSGPGVHSFSRTLPAYFSIDGGVTNLHAFNYSGSGDRCDWVTSATDANSAYLSTGKHYTMSAEDWTELLAMGWGNTINPAYNFDGTHK